MPNIHVLTGAGESPGYPVVRKIGVADLKDAVAKGIDDFMAMPTHVIFLAVIYPLVGLFLACITFDYKVIPLLYPLAAGFALIGPFAASLIIRRPIARRPHSVRLSGCRFPSLRHGCA